MSDRSLFLLPALFAALAGVSIHAAANDGSGTYQAKAELEMCDRPVWPADALKNKREGTVTVSFLVDTDNRMIDSRIKKSSSHRDLDQAALEAISKCKFHAAMQDGKPIREWMDVQYVWSAK